MTPGQEANADNSGNFFDLLNNNGMFSVLIRIYQVGSNEYTQQTFHNKTRKVL